MAIECQVCLASLGGDEPVVTLPCMHAFHEYCINQVANNQGEPVLGGNLECPICRITGHDASGQQQLIEGGVGQVAASEVHPAAAGSAEPAAMNADPAEAAVAYLQSLGDASQGELDELMNQEKELLHQKKVLKKAIRAKKQRDERLMSKAAKSLSGQQLMELASKKMSVEKAKAEAKAKAKANPKPKAKTKAKAKA